MCGDKVTAYAGAFDWKESAAAKLDVDIYENDLSLLEGGAISCAGRVHSNLGRGRNKTRISSEFREHERLPCLWTSCALRAGAIGAFKRIQKPIDRVVNTFLEEWLGAPCKVILSSWHQHL